MAAALLSHQSSTGFYKAPVCKGLIGCMFLTCTAIHIPIAAHLRQYLNCEVPGVLTSGQLWKILFNRLTFIYSKDIVCSAFVIYFFRIFERRMGSQKFASHLFGTCALATILEICTILVFSHFQVDYPNAGFLSPGMYGLIFPLYVLYYLDIPQVAVTRFLGIPITGKTTTYLLGLQIASSSVPTLISSLCGIIAGIIYRSNFLKVQKWLVIPSVVGRFCDKVFGWFLYSKEPKLPPMGATIELQRQEQAEVWEQQYLHRAQDFQDFRQVRGQGFAERLIDDPQQDGGLADFFFRRRGANDGNIEPSTENIRILVDMGFDRNRVLEALRSSSNDLETATSILLHQ